MWSPEKPEEPLAQSCKQNKFESTLGNSHDEPESIPKEKDATNKNKSVEL